MWSLCQGRAEQRRAAAGWGVSTHTLTAEVTGKHGTRAPGSTKGDTLGAAICKGPPDQSHTLRRGHTCPRAQDTNTEAAGAVGTVVCWPTHGPSKRAAAPPRGRLLPARMQVPEQHLPRGWGSRKSSSF